MLAEDLTRRVNAYDFIRLIAAVEVLLEHTSNHLGVPFLWHRSGDALWVYEGLHTFFIISGLFVFRSADRLMERDRTGTWWRDFYENRVLRIGPALWVYGVIAVIFVVAVGAAASSDIASVRGVSWILSMAFLAPFYSPGFLEDFGVGNVNGSLATIAVEVSFYVFVPLLVLASRRIRIRVFLGVLLAAGAVTWVLSPGVDGMAGKLLKVTFLPYLWWFGLGVAWYLWGLKHVRLTWPRAAVAAAVYIAAVQANEHLFDIPLVALIKGLALSYVVVCVGERGPRAFEKFPKRFGDLSYGSYIWHMLIVNAILWWGLDSHLPDYTVTFVVLAVSLTLAALSWNFIEKPALKRKRVSSRSGRGLNEGTPADEIGPQPKAPSVLNR
ncbi:acyltransferase family protein [Micromonospora sp. NPDC047740]|uniref:acyltransferase family protein n=1 Tax=Micromonospora sp. NPDC047740 TaxID=3364254 RepID=UPI00371357EF